MEHGGGTVTGGLYGAGGCCGTKQMGLGLGFPRTFKRLGLSGSIFGSRLILVVGPLSIGLKSVNRHLMDYILLYFSFCFRGFCLICVCTGPSQNWGLQLPLFAHCRVTRMEQRLQKGQFCPVL
ncbi:hypothetical protein V6Z11_A12G127200 [Gossypium hirsutum]